MAEILQISPLDEGSFHLLLLAEKFCTSTLIALGLKLCSEVPAKSYHLSPEFYFISFFSKFVSIEHNRKQHENQHFTSRVTLD